MTKQIKKIIIISLGVAFSVVAIPGVLHASQVSGNLDTGMSTGIDVVTTNCAQVSHGTVASNYPTCTLTCNSGYTKSGNTCVVKSSGGGGGGSTPVKPVTTTPLTVPTTTTPTYTTTPSSSGGMFVFSIVLKLGSKGNEVKELQKILIEKGYLVGTADGYFGKMTEDAVKKFQIANGLVADGVVGPMARQALNKIITVVTSVTTTTPVDTATVQTLKLKLNLKFGLSGDEVKLLQGILKVKGYFTGEPTGYFGAITQNAVRAFQKANGLTADGVVGPMTRSLLNQ